MYNELNGYDNEYEFVKYLNGKKVGQLHPLFRELIEHFYPDCDEK